MKPYLTWDKTIGSCALTDPLKMISDKASWWLIELCHVLTYMVLRLSHKYFQDVIGWWWEKQKEKTSLIYNLCQLQSSSVTFDHHYISSLIDHSLPRMPCHCCDRTLTLSISRFTLVCVCPVLWHQTQWLESLHRISDIITLIITVSADSQQNLI